MKTVYLKKQSISKRTCKNCGKDISHLPEGKEFCCRSCLLTYSRAKMKERELTFA